ncbi:MAG: DUF4391 domain-containing protein [Desulfobacterales bacterium]|nr:DUF4391 domain-containing protein [Desulfobacterales bacterium]
MYAYPPQARVDRRLPKSVIYKNAKPSKPVKDLFASQVIDIVWKYKLAQETINLPPKEGYTEIQIFDIMLKGPRLDPKILATIDKAIPYSLFFRLHLEDRIKRVAAFKRPNQSGERHWVVGAYFESGWRSAAAPESTLPLALDLRSLYEQMLLPYIDLPRRSDETLAALVERHQRIRNKQRQLKALKTQMGKEKQFNRKVELNALVRELEDELRLLTAP